MTDKEKYTFHEQFKIPSPKDLRQLRADAGLSQQDLAEHINISQGMISAYERGDKNVASHHLRDMLEVFDEIFEDQNNE